LFISSNYAEILYRLIFQRIWFYLHTCNFCLNQIHHRLYSC